MSVRIIAISDTHGYHDKFDIPDGDILIHAGDMTKMGTLPEVVAFNDFMARMPHKHKVVIAGNHDFCFEGDPEKAQALLTNCTYLCDQMITIEGIRIYGTPWSPWFFDWAFNLKRGEPLREKWAHIPDDTDILLSHTPPHSILDRTITDELVGCVDLLARVKVIQPRYHIFGHIHEGHGQNTIDDTTFINAALCTVDYRPDNRPIVIEYVH